MKKYFLHLLLLIHLSVPILTTVPAVLVDSPLKVTTSVHAQSSLDFLVPPPRAYPSTDLCIKAGVGPAPQIGYYSFGGNAIDNDVNRLYNVWRKGSDHNSAADGDIVLWFSDDGGVTNSAEYVIQADPIGFNSTNPNVMVANNHRVIVFWYEQTAPNISNPKFKYSDNVYNAASPAAATWSAVQTFSTDFAGFYMDGPGEGITLANGDLLKPVWTSTGGTSSVWVYGSTAASNGLVWTQKALISADAVTPNDETTIVQLPNDNVMAFIRCNTCSFIRTSVSANNGSTWSAVVDSTIPAIGGKTPVAISSNGMLFGLLRATPSGRTGYFWSTDYTTWTYGLIDARTGLYMYGGVSWSTALGKFISDYSIEAQNAAAYAGPTLIINKFIELNPVAPPYSYDVDYQGVRDFASARGVTYPVSGSTLDLANNTFVAGLRSDGNLTQSDGYFVFANNDATLEGFAKFNWRRPWIQGTPINSPTYGVNGYDFNGTTQYFHTNMTVSNQANFLLNTAELVYETSENVSAIDVQVGAGNGSFSTISNAILFGIRTASSNIVVFLNTGTAATFSTSATGNGFYEIERTTSSSVGASKNGVSLGTVVNSSTGRTTNSVLIGAQLFADLVAYYSTMNCRIWGMGGLKGSWYARWNTRITTIGLTPN